MAVIFGTNLGELINLDDGVTELADEVYGFGGNDDLYGYGGDDFLRGGLGFDYLDGGDGIDTVSYDDSDLSVAVDLAAGGTGGAANGDTYYSVENVIGSHLQDFLKGDAFANRISGGLGGDNILGEGGADVLYGGDGNDILQGKDANDQLHGEAGSDQLDGGELNDTLKGGAENDVLSGGAGVDTLVGGLGADVLDGGDGADYASYGPFYEGAVEEGIIVDLAANTGSGGRAEGDTYFSIENVVGSVFADIILGKDDGNVLGGDRGDDQVFGRGGNDFLGGGYGNDFLMGGEGFDYLTGGDGIDTASYQDSGVGVTIRLDSADGAGFGGTAEGDDLVSIERVVGSAYDDSLSSDLYFASLLNGAAGNDLLVTGLRADVLKGGAGIDTASYDNFTQGVRVSLVTGRGYDYSAEGDRLDSIENLIGTIESDRLLGSAGRNRLEGSLGDDVLSGGGGADDLRGGGGGDRLEGGAGNDRLVGGGGADRFLLGSAKFGQDTVVGFEDGFDLFDLRGSGLTLRSFVKSQSGSDAVLTLSGDLTQTITLTNTNAASVDSADFLT